MNLLSILLLVLLPLTAPWTAVLGQNWQASSAWNGYSQPPGSLGRAGHVAVSGGSEYGIYVHGGYYKSGSSFLLHSNTTFLFNLNSKQWSAVATGSTGPSRRCHHAMVTDASQTYALLFGGVDLSTVAVFNDVWIFTFATQLWTRATLQLPGGLNSMPAFMMHTMVNDFTDNSFYVYGGYNYTALASSGLYRLVVTSEGVVSVSMVSSSPTPVFSHASVFHRDAVTGERFLVSHSGLTLLTLSPATVDLKDVGRLQVYRFATGTWQELTLAHPFAGASKYHGGRALYNPVAQQMWILGGMETAYAQTNAVARTLLLSMRGVDARDWVWSEGNPMASVLTVYSSLTLVRRPSSTGMMAVRFGGSLNYFLGMSAASASNFATDMEWTVAYAPTTLTLAVTPFTLQTAAPRTIAVNSSSGTSGAVLYTPLADPTLVKVDTYAAANAIMLQPVSVGLILLIVLASLSFLASFHNYWMRRQERRQEEAMFYYE